MTDGYLNFDEYIVASDLHKREWAGVRKVVIGLQNVDGDRNKKKLEMNLC